MHKSAFTLVPTLLLVLVAVFSCSLPQILTPGPTATPSAIPTYTASPTATITATPLHSATPTATHTPSVTSTPTATLTPSATPFALNTHPELNRYIYVDQMAQRMYIFESGVLTRTMLVSTGLPEPGTLTPAWEGKVGWFVGTFFSFGTYADEAWFLFNDGFLIHGLPYLYDKDGKKVYQDAEAQGTRPASHGCIRLFPEDIEWLSAWNPSGVLMTISDPYVDYWHQKLGKPSAAPTATVTAGVTQTAVVTYTATAATAAVTATP
ncbi:MAG: L,D-transpeptidase family protein [Chloroflexi bacterium]|nr:L,D-transpeptidase family protein [Chloroflexota bacterium]